MTGLKQNPGYEGDTPLKVSAPRRRQLEHIANGMCYRCGCNPVSEKRTCQNCLDRINARVREIKDVVFNAYGGYACECCGETITEFLTLDHKNDDGADHRRELGGRGAATGHALYRWIVKNNFPDMFRVLCFNCNCGRRFNGGICPHKTKGD